MSEQTNHDYLSDQWITTELERIQAEAESGCLLPPQPEGRAGAAELNQAILLLALLWRNIPISKPAYEGLVELRAIWPKEREEPPPAGAESVLCVFSTLSEFPGLFKRAKAPNTAGYGIYFGINPRPLSRKKTEEDIEVLVACFADLDGKNFKGGKDEAWKRISEFPIEPTAIVDSGRGYHAYWVFKEPIFDRTNEETRAFEQTQIGLARTLGGDIQFRNPASVGRLPGTIHTKDKNDPRPVRIVRVSEKLYGLGDLDEYRDHAFVAPPPVPDIEGEDYQGVTATISQTDAKSAAADVKKLEVSPKTRQRILTGECEAETGKDSTRSGRDFRIMCGLVAAGYSYETAKAIFLNKYLPCSDRVLSDRNKSLQILSYDFSQAVQYLRKKASAETPQVKAVIDIKRTSELVPEERLRHVQQYIVSDLFKGVGQGFKNTTQGEKFFFDSSEKMLLDIASEDFRCFLRNRYGLPEKDMVEVLAAVTTKIWAEGAEIEPYTFARYEPESRVLYISRADNSVFRLDGEKIELVDNGADQVIFEFRPDIKPVDIKPPFEAVRYFRDGFDWPRCRDESLLSRHLISLTSFATEAEHDLSPEDQRYLLALYFYSLFFESILEEKPLITWTGVKASGKGLVSTAIGKILFGPAFLPSHLADDIRDFQTAMCENYYVILDNVDSFVRSAVTDALCRYATGERIAKRKLYTDSDEFKVRPRVFLAITSRDPKFKRDDLVDRLIIFNTEKIRNPKSRTELFKGVLEARPALWAEILTNLNDIVRLLREKRDWNPAGNFRVADWELWGKKLHKEDRLSDFTSILEKMSREKARFGLEDDPLYILLHDLCYDQGEVFDGVSAGKIYDRLLGIDPDFKRAYKSSVGLGKRLNNVIEELRNEFDIKAVKQRGKRLEYYISAKG